MSLKFCFGASGGGKSYNVYKEIINKSMVDSKKNFFIIVPDQFTMQTQKELVRMHPREGIMNIDVLSFSRLAHRIFEEVGKPEIPILDDTGKSLILQKVALSMKEELPVLGGHIHRQGYIHEVKSAISEFMQYGIDIKQMEELISYAQNRGALFHKLKDLKKIYASFLEYIHGNFITTEETLGLLQSSLHKSKLILDSVFVFDGFTGFTPIQNRLIQELMGLAEEVIVTITLDAYESPFEPTQEHKLFYLSKKTVADLEKLGKEIGVNRGTDIFLKENNSNRFAANQELSFLEKNLFRSEKKQYEKESKNIKIFECLTPIEEIRQIGLEIKRLVQDGNDYRDIALILGDLEGYSTNIEQEFQELEIPYYIDKTRSIILNPMIEYIKSGLDLFIKDFSYESVFHFLRSGMSKLTREEVDLLENYLIQTGIRGFKRWNREFTNNKKKQEEELFLIINNLRKKVMEEVTTLIPLYKKRLSAKTFVDALYDFLVENQVEEKLAAFEYTFNENQDLVRGKEYGQIYLLVMKLLEEIYSLLGEEEISLKEFSEILEAGFEEIEVGTIPQNVDRVLVGDIERTRLQQVKVLFLLGVNDGNIPKNVSKGGIISDVDREFLRESSLELSPSPRQQMYIQRFYLYLNLTKPSEKLYLSYGKMNHEGKSIRPSYLIDTIRNLFPYIQIERPSNAPILKQILTMKEGKGYLAEGLREYVEGVAHKFSISEFASLYAVYRENESQEKLLKVITEGAFYRYRKKDLSKIVARAVYGMQLENSVSRLETYAACAYKHFLQYGLSLREREEYGFESVDMGNIFHGVLDEFAFEIEGRGYSWFDFPKEVGEEIIEKSLEEFAVNYGAGVLYSSARNAYGIKRMERILKRTVSNLQIHLNQGKFIPDAHELSFYYTEDISAINIALSEEEKMRIRGRIDRVDIAESGDEIFVKVIDYKSGSKQFDLAAVYYGLTLQLVVYMNAALEMEAKKHVGKKVLPAAMLYYHVDDPTIETPIELSEEELNDQIKKQLKMVGVVNDREDIIEKLDELFTDKSDIIPVEKKKDGTFSARSSVMSTEELEVLSRFVSKKVKNIGREILDGRKEINPYEKGGKEACTYCAYKKVCGFEIALPGYEKRQLLENTEEEIMDKMKGELE